MSSPSVEVTILTYNRPNMFRQALDSVLKQDYANLIVKVSDNSTDDRTEKLMEAYKGIQNLRYVRRVPSLPALDHFKKTLKEPETDYFILFHDDDILIPNAIAKLVKALENNPKASASASNAFLIKNDQFTQETLMPFSKNDKTINSGQQLSEIYMNGSGHPPFPGYLYRTSATRNLDFLFSEGGKYADVSFLIKLASVGPLEWLSECLMYYRQHAENDSNSVDIRAMLRLIGFIRKNGLADQKIIKDFKMRNYYVWMKRRGLSKVVKDKFGHAILVQFIKYLLVNPKLVTKRLIKKLI